MTKTEPSTVVKIDFLYDQKYRNRVKEKKNPDLWIDTSIKANGNDVYGGSRGVVTGNACLVILDLLDSVKAIYHNERSIVHFDDGPSWLSVGSINTTTAEIVACHTLKGAKNPEKRLDIAREYYITKHAWKNAVDELVDDFIDTILDICPDLSNHRVIETIRSKNQEVKQLDDGSGA